VKVIAISEFKAKCLSLLEEVEKTKTPLLVTKFGKPIAEVNPHSLNQKNRSWLGSMKVEIKLTSSRRCSMSTTGKSTAIETLARHPHMAVGSRKSR